MLCAMAAASARAQVLNLTTGQSFPTIAEAIRAASPGDELLANAARFGLEPVIDFDNKAITLRSTAEIFQPTGFTTLLAPGATLASDFKADAIFAGLLRVPADNPTFLLSQSIRVDAEGRLVVDPGAWLIAKAPSGIFVEGLLNLGPSARADLDFGLFAGDGVPLRIAGARPIVRVGARARMFIEGSFAQAGDAALEVSRDEIAGPNTLAAIGASKESSLAGSFRLEIVGVTPALGDAFHILRAPAIQGAYAASVMPALPGALRLALRLEAAGADTLLVARVESTTASPSLAPVDSTLAPTIPVDAAIGDFTSAIDPDADIIVVGPSATGAPNGSVFVLSSSAPVALHEPGPGRLDLDAAGAGADPRAAGLEPILETPVGMNPVSLAIGDFDAPSFSDVAVVNMDDDTMTILLGDGVGGFIEHAVIPTGDGPNAVAAADLDLDGDLDLTVTNEFDATLMIFHNDGAANFTLVDTVGVGEGKPKSVDPGEVDGDGEPDLIVVTKTSTLGRDGEREAPDGALVILRANGLGGFDPPIEFRGGFDPFRASVADLNRDGRPDVVVANAGLVIQPDGSRQNELSIFLNASDKGAVAFLPAVQTPVGQGLASLETADFDRDGDPDIAIITGSVRAVQILRNDFEADAPGGVALAPQAPIQSAAAPFLLTAGDLDADGDTDLVAIGTPVIARVTNSLVEILENAAPRSADLNGDGHVNGADLGLLLGAWGTNSALADLDESGVVDGADLGLLLGAWTG